jgi:hypothetical protein
MVTHDQLGGAVLAWGAEISLGMALISACTSRTRITNNESARASTGDGTFKRVHQTVVSYRQSSQATLFPQGCGCFLWVFAAFGVVGGFQGHIQSGVEEGLGRVLVILLGLAVMSLSLLMRWTTTTVLDWAAGTIKQGRREASFSEFSGFERGPLRGRYEVIGAKIRFLGTTPPFEIVVSRRDQAEALEQLIAKETKLPLQNAAPPPAPPPTPDSTPPAPSAAPAEDWTL